MIAGQINTVEIQIYNAETRQDEGFTVKVLYQRDVWMAHGTIRGSAPFAPRVDTSRIQVSNQLSGLGFAHFATIEQAQEVCDWLANRFPGFDTSTFKDLPGATKREFGRLIVKHGGKV